MTWRININGVDYEMRLTSEQQFVNGREWLFVADHGHREIRISGRIRELLCNAISHARNTAPGRPSRRRRLTVS